jgi:DNA polymerase alpha subunit A
LVNVTLAPTKTELLSVPTWLSVYDSLAVTSDETLSSGFFFSTFKSFVDALELDGTLCFFWLDYLDKSISSDWGIRMPRH